MVCVTVLIMVVSAIGLRGECKIEMAQAMRVVPACFRMVRSVLPQPQSSTEARVNELEFMLISSIEMSV